MSKEELIEQLKQYIKLCESKDSCNDCIIAGATVNTLYAKDTQLDGYYDALRNSELPTINNLYIDYSEAVLDSSINITISGETKTILNILI